MGIEYKLRRRESHVRRGDRIWKEGKVGNPTLDKIAIGVNGTIAKVDWQEYEAIAVFDDGTVETYNIHELRNLWTDALQGLYIIEEEASADAKPINTVNGHPFDGEE